MNLEAILDDCLIRLQQGESVGDCLDRYPQQAAELKPMLAAAARLRVLSAQRLAADRRLAGKRALRQAFAAQSERVRPAAWTGWFSWLKAPVAVGMAALLLFVVAAASAVAASRPGDPTYPARVVIERAATWPLRGNQRVAAELAVAERRLADVQRAGRADPIALGALVSSDETAASVAETLPPTERAAVAERIEAHATGLSILADAAADDATRQRLAVAARQLQRLVGRLRIRLERGDGAEGMEPPAPPMHGMTVAPRPTPLARPTTAPEHTPRVGMPTDAPPTPAATPTRRPTGATAELTVSPPAGTRGERPTAPAAAMTAGPASPAPGIVATRRAEWTPEPTRRATDIAPGPMPGSPPAGPTRRPVATPEAPAPTWQPPGGGPPANTPAPPPQPQPTRRRRP